MLPRCEEIELTESAYRHGFHDEDLAEMLRGRHLVIRCRRGRSIGYEVFGRNAEGAYLLAVGSVIESGVMRVFRVFHINRTTDAERRRFQRQVRS